MGMPDLFDEENLDYSSASMSSRDLNACKEA